MKRILAIVLPAIWAASATGAVEAPTLGPIEAEGFRAGVTPVYPRGQAPRFTLRLPHEGPTNAVVQVRWRALDHCVEPGIAFAHEESVALEAGRTRVLEQEMALRSPGPYWISVEVANGSAVLKAKPLGILYDAESYLPPLIPPPDFAEFWQGKLRAMRAIPFEEKLVEAPSKGNARFVHYDLEIKGPSGQPVRTYLRVPRKPGPWDAEVISYWGSDKEDKIMATQAKLEGQPVGPGQCERGADRIRVGAPQPEDSKYTRWATRDDNNFLDSYLLNVRMADYLRARPDVVELQLLDGRRVAAGGFAPGSGRGSFQDSRCGEPQRDDLRVLRPVDGNGEWPRGVPLGRGLRAGAGAWNLSERPLGDQQRP